MKKIFLPGDSFAFPPGVATIGFFDGVHRGHRHLIASVLDDAKAMNLSPIVITFDKHPRQVLQSTYVPRQLSDLDEKLRLLSEFPLFATVILHFDEAMAQLSAHDFMKTVLRDRLNVKRLVIGYDNRFGHNQEDGFEDYVRYGKELSIEVVRSTAFLLKDHQVSSSLIRRSLKEGNIELANDCLGYAYTLEGKVRHGFKRGHQLGFPTANIDLSGNTKMIPAFGVYAVRVGLENDDETYYGMMSIGVNPTFDHGEESLEVNIFDFDKDIYGRWIRVSFLSYLRKEKKFESEQLLSEQLERDKRATIGTLKKISDYAQND